MRDILYENDLISSTHLYGDNKYAPSSTSVSGPIILYESLTLPLRLVNGMHYLHAANYDSWWIIRKQYSQRIRGNISVIEQDSMITEQFTLRIR